VWKRKGNALDDFRRRWVGTFKKAWFGVVGWIYQVQLQAVVSTVMNLWVP
jgi:hypothetical protein